MVLAAVCSLSDTALLVRDRKVIQYRWFIAGWVVIGAAMAAWSLDLQGVICDPGNHWVSGHALWHLLDAFGFYCVFRYYEQFQVLRSAGALRPVPRP